MAKKRQSGNPANRGASSRVTPKGTKARIVEPPIRKAERMSARMAARRPPRSEMAVHREFRDLPREEQDAILRGVLGELDAREEPTDG